MRGERMRVSRGMSGVLAMRARKGEPDRDQTVRGPRRLDDLSGGDDSVTERVDGFSVRTIAPRSAYG